ncbi:hypothetical protein V8C35DRAFT_267444 [Trichoderma chlorosporum]
MAMVTWSRRGQMRIYSKFKTEPFFPSLLGSQTLTPAKGDRISVLLPPALLAACCLLLALVPYRTVRAAWPSTRHDTTRHDTIRYRLHSHGWRRITRIRPCPCPRSDAQSQANTLAAKRVSQPHVQVRVLAHSLLADFQAVSCADSQRGGFPTRDAVRHQQSASHPLYLANQRGGRCRWEKTFFIPRTRMQPVERVFAFGRTASPAKPPGDASVFVKLYSVRVHKKAYPSLSIWYPGLG